MNPKRPARPILAALLLVLTAAGASRADDDLKARADEAWRQERQDEAIRLYREVVKRDPQDVGSRKRLALLLSWNDRLGEAEEMYRTLLAERPHDDEVTAELAKVYSWDGKYRESEALYRELLAARPSDPSLRLRYAEVLGWDGRYGDARKIYLDMIAKREETADAAVGLGNLALWEGDLGGATRWYERALAVHPGDARARVGLAQVREAQGRKRDALRETEAVLRESPRDRDARRVKERIESSLRPFVSAAFDRFLDTDDNDLKLYRLWGGFHLDPQSELTVTWLRHAATSNCTLTPLCDGAPGEHPRLGERFEDHANTLMGAYDATLASGLGVGGRLGAVRRELFSGRSTTEALGGAWVSLNPDPDLGYGFSAGREAILDTAPLMENKIDFDSVAGNVTWAFGGLWTLRGNAAHSWVTDGNRRESAFASLGARLPVKRPRTVLGVSGRWLHYAENPESGYFSPDRLWTALLTATIQDEFLARRLYYAVDLSGGFQQIAFHGDTSSRGTDRVYSWSVLGGVNLFDHVAFEASLGRTNQAQQSATGFEQKHWGFMLRGTW